MQEHSSISVIIPVYNGADHLDACLKALESSTVQPLECIVVDDGSTDNSAAIAKHRGASVLTTGGRCGPARARNIGAQSSRGEILLFLDADVCVHLDTLARVAEEFSVRPGLDAVIGSYDRRPTARGFVSEYRNLMHHFVHHRGNREASTFWAGCGAIRKPLFLEAGGFDENYRAASIEDIELGYRLTRAGRKLALNPQIQVTHLKSWDLQSMLRTDFFYRALPWSELTLRSGNMPNDLNLRISQRISVALVALLISIAAYLSLTHGVFLVALLLTLFVALSGYWTQTSGISSKIGMGLAAVAIVVLSWTSGAYQLLPALLSGSAALLIRHRYALSGSRPRPWIGMLAGIYLVSLVGFIWFFLPWHPLLFVFLFFVLLLLILNQQFYTFLAADRGKFFACAAIPFHILYFASSGLAFVIAAIRHWAMLIPGLRRRTPAGELVVPRKT